MRSKFFNNIILDESATIKEAMRAIDASGQRVVYVLDSQRRVTGAASDSEIRRAILKGMDISTLVKGIINPHPVLLREKELSNQNKVRIRLRRLLERMPDSRYVLVIDSYKRPSVLLPIHELIKGRGVHRDNPKPVNKNILVVGGAGYLGSILVRRLLLEGFKVRVLDILMYGKESLHGFNGEGNFELIEGDMRNISTLVKALYGVDAVVNLAAIVGDPACKNNPETAIETNYLANKALAEACKYHQINRFIYASTCSVYGSMDGNKHLDEDSPLNPVSLYARSKIQSEGGILALEDENFSPTILRMGTLYGLSPRMRFDLVVNAMTKSAILENKIFVHGGGKQWRPFLNVEDAAEAFLKCLKAPLAKIKGEKLNVGSSAQNYQIIQVARIINRCFPRAKLVMDDSLSDLRNYFVSFSRIEKTLGFRTYRGLENSVRQIKKSVKNRQIKDINHPKYYNVEYIK
jgi:nucleoside-diphosphate-sugar epimerase